MKGICGKISMPTLNINLSERPGAVPSPTAWEKVSVGRMRVVGEKLYIAPGFVII
jgi:hypothetical protein